jgi:UDP-N-acetylmuramoyl-tripeptide--D-alanyl-D-alanine ligase
MLRLLSTAVVVTLIPVVGGLLIFGETDFARGTVSYLSGWFLASMGAPLWTLLAGYLMRPIERSIHEGFKRQARRKLADRPDLTIVGITGSFGKTSTKHILAEILEQKYQVLATPASYNTPMGICIVINEQLEDHHQILVLEMGARYEGDIRELCEIAPPDIAVVTSVGRAHLETLGTLEDVARVKEELIRHMKPGGTAVLNADDRRVRAMASAATNAVWQVSREGKSVEIQGRNLTYTTRGSTFEVEDETGATTVFETQLLGRHNMLNILLATAVGRITGLRLRQIAHAVRRVEPIDHRLQLRREGNITVIDDAFNANPVGARNAVEILGSFDSGRRIIVTPGMIELGDQQAAENRKLGNQIGQHADLAVLVGEAQTRPIRQGLEEVGYPDDQIKTFASLFEAQEFLEGYLQPGDTVLYENDLPDQYNEPVS